MTPLHHLAFAFTAPGLDNTANRINPPPVANISKEFQNFSTGLPLVLNAGIIIAGVIMVILIAVGGVQWMLAMGSEEKSMQARQLLTSAAIGFFLVLGTWAIMHLVFGVLGYSFG